MHGQDNETCCSWILVLAAALRFMSGFFVVLCSACCGVLYRLRSAHTQRCECSRWKREAVVQHPGCAYSCCMRFSDPDRT